MKRLRNGAGPLTPGDCLAERFRLRRLIGGGGLGRVWLAEDTQLENEPVACKVLKEELFDDRRAVADLKREVLMTRRLRHPNILAVYTFWDTAEHRFITMEYVDGRSLADALAERSAPFPLHDILPWVAQLCDALDHAHGQGVLHRDVKPGNVLLDKQGNAQLADFGIARLAGDVRTRLTGETSCGTLMYVSPEQLMGERLDARSDLYSLAASVYELVAGKPPFSSGSVITQIQLKPAPPIGHLNERANSVLLKALAKDPDRRYRHCNDFHEALSKAAQALPQTVPREAIPAAPPRGPAAPPRGPAAPPRGPAAAPPLTYEEGPLSDTTKDLEPAEEMVMLPRRDTSALRMRLGAVLLGANLITPEQLDKALTEQLGTTEELGAILIRLGYTDEEAIAHALSRQLQIPYAALDREPFDTEVTRQVPASFARRHRCLPLRREGGTVVVAMADPLDLPTLNELEAVFHTQVKTLVAAESAIMCALDRQAQNDAFES